MNTNAAFLFNRRQRGLPPEAYVALLLPILVLLYAMIRSGEFRTFCLPMVGLLGSSSRVLAQARRVQPASWEIE